MGLNIKNERVHRLAREAAALTGTSQTGAIERALELYLRHHGADPDAARVRERVDLVRGLVARYAAEPAPDHGADHGVRAIEDLYDDATGLPR